MTSLVLNSRAQATIYHGLIYTANLGSAIENATSLRFASVSLGFLVFVHFLYGSSTNS